VLRVYNTLSRSYEVFEPVEPDVVKMYVCGPTVYDYTHVGHVRTYVAFDVIKRYLHLAGYDVIHVQNITDIDDKIIRRAQREGRDWREIADTYTKDYLEALEALNISIDIHPRVTEHIREIIEFIELLIEKGHAYVAESGSVYFDVDTYLDYGKLSNRKDRELWGQEEEFIHEKKNPYDFALWKAAKPGEPSWESPWGRGRPGWHIECSVMSTKYLGSQFDIHGGGSDLIFPHHENEIAQSEAALGVKPWVKYWLHTGMLDIRGQKMSKSLGNIVPIKEMLKKWRKEVVRLWLATAHYRKRVAFTDDALSQAESNYKRLVNALSLVKKVLKEAELSHRLSDEGIKALREMERIRRGFYESMNDDFNASAAFSYVYELTTLIFKHLENKAEHSVALRAFTLLKELNQVLGVLDSHIQEAVYAIMPEELLSVIVDVRGVLRARRDYELADWIRDRLAKLGVKLLDEGEKTRWILEV